MTFLIIVTVVLVVIVLVVREKLTGYGIADITVQY